DVCRTADLTGLIRYAILSVRSKSRDPLNGTKLRPSPPRPRTVAENLLGGRLHLAAARQIFFLRGSVRRFRFGAVLSSSVAVLQSNVISETIVGLTACWWC